MRQTAAVLMRGKDKGITRQWTPGNRQ